MAKNRVKQNIYQIDKQIKKKKTVDMMNETINKICLSRSSSSDHMP